MQSLGLINLCIFCLFTEIIVGMATGDEVERDSNQQCAEAPEQVGTWRVGQQP